MCDSTPPNAYNGLNLTPSGRNQNHIPFTKAVSLVHLQKRILVVYLFSEIYLWQYKHVWDLNWTSRTCSPSPRSRCFTLTSFVVVCTTYELTDLKQPSPSCLPDFYITLSYIEPGHIASVYLNNWWTDPGNCVCCISILNSTNNNIDKVGISNDK